MTRLMAQRNAASVLPLPVGARMRVDSPRAIAGQPCCWGGVGVAKLARNQSATDEWNRSNTSPRFATFTILARFNFLAISSSSGLVLLAILEGWVTREKAWST